MEISELMNKWAIQKAEEEKLEEQKQALKKETSDLVKQIKEITQSSSFKYGDKYYQVRIRDGLAYMCTMDVEPGSWKRKNKTEENS